MSKRPDWSELVARYGPQIAPEPEPDGPRVAFYGDDTRGRLSPNAPCDGCRAVGEPKDIVVTENGLLVLCPRCRERRS